jgi:hypothetical protein
MAKGKSLPPGRPKGTPKTGGSQKGTPNKVTVEVRDAAKAIVEDAEYRERFIARAHAGELAPALESMLWYYAYGKPKERVELEAPKGMAFTLKLDDDKA